MNTRPMFETIKSTLLVFFLIGHIVTIIIACYIWQTDHYKIYWIFSDVTTWACSITIVISITLSCIIWIKLISPTIPLWLTILNTFISATLGTGGITLLNNVRYINTNYLDKINIKNGWFYIRKNWTEEEKDVLIEKYSSQKHFKTSGLTELKIDSLKNIKTKMSIDEIYDYLIQIDKECILEAKKAIQQLNEAKTPKAGAWFFDMLNDVFFGKYSLLILTGVIIVSGLYIYQYLVNVGYSQEVLKNMKQLAEGQTTSNKNIATLNKGLNTVKARLDGSQTEVSFETTRQTIAEHAIKLNDIRKETVLSAVKETKEQMLTDQQFMNKLLYGLVMTPNILSVKKNINEAIQNSYKVTGTMGDQLQNIEGRLVMINKQITDTDTLQKLLDERVKAVEKIIEYRNQVKHVASAGLRVIGDGLQENSNIFIPATVENQLQSLIKNIGSHNEIFKVILQRIELIEAWIEQFKLQKKQ